MYPRNLEALLNSGEANVRNYITTGCFEWSSSEPVEKHLQSHDHHRVHEVLDYLLHENIKPQDLAEWIKCLFSGRLNPKKFLQEVKKYDKSSKCGLVWTTNFVAYRCRTCAISLCMSLCAECFLNGNHEGHDFNMFRSQAGGACDCGDQSVMKEDGFCKHHQSKSIAAANIESASTSTLKSSLPPNSLLCITKEIMPKLLYHLVLAMRENRRFDENNKLNILLDEVFIILSDLGTVMQEILSECLTDDQLYKSFFGNVPQIGTNDQENFTLQHRLKILEENYQTVKDEVSLKTIFPEQPDPIVLNHEEVTSQISAFNSELIHENFLDEIIFWTAMYEYPSNLITFLLKMLPNEEYKLKFSKSFLKHYFRIAMLILHPTYRFRNNNRDIYYNKLAHAVVHVSVQLFSNENLVLHLCREENLFEIIVLTLKHAIEGNQKNFWGVLVPNQLFQKKNDPRPMVVSCRHHIMSFHRFWPVISDLNNLLTHEKVSLLFLNDEKLIDLWLEFIMAFQGMNCNKKADFVEDENMDYKAAYLSELEISASFMWALISHLKDSSTKHLTVRFTKHILKWLKIWLDAAKPSLKEVDVLRFSFHLPLHRYFAVFLHHAVTVQGATVEELLPLDPDLLKSIIYHPLQTLTVFQHILAEIWKYNGLQIRAQAVNYIQAHFCNSTIDPDMFLIQLAASYIDPEDFVGLWASVHVLEYYLHIRQADFELTEKADFLLENAFTFLAFICTQRINMGLSTEEVTRKEMIELLSLDQKSHSQIQEALPFKCGYTQQASIIETLNDIAEYKQPEVEASGGLVQGYFMLKNRVWEQEYDPLFVLYRNATRRDFQTSMQRYANFARQNGKQLSSTMLWPPFRIPPNTSEAFRNTQNILNSCTLQAFYFSVLVNANSNVSYISQHLLSIVVFLMELTFIQSTNDQNEKNWSSFSMTSKTVPFVYDRDFSNWFSTSDIVENFLVTFQNFRMKEDAYHSKVMDIFSTVFDDYLHTGHHHEMMDYHTNEVPHCSTGVRIPNAEDKTNDTNASMYSQRYFIFDEEPDFEEEHSATHEELSEDNSESMESSAGGSKSSSRRKSSEERFDKRCVELPVNESFLTILLKLFSKLSGKKDAFKTTPASLQQFDFESRFGDGPYFIGCLLKRFILACANRIELKNNPDSFETSQKSLDAALKFVEEQRRLIWPRKMEEPMTTSSTTAQESLRLQRETSLEGENMELDSETIEKMEKKRRAKELHEKIMNRYKNKQTDFMQNNVEKDCSSQEKPQTSADTEFEETNISDSASSYSSKSYDCAICGESGNSKLERSFVQITYLQSTSILGNAQSRTLSCEIKNSEHTAFDKRTVSNSLPLSEEEYLDITLHRHMYRNSFQRIIGLYSSNFSQSSWLSSFNIGWCGGVHAQSCGHYMHLDCFQSYVSHMKREPDSLFEFSCPLCRKIGNSVSPIIPNFANIYALVKSRSGRNSPQVVNEIWNLLSNSDTSRLANTTPEESQFLKVFSTAMEDLMRATEAQYRSICVNPCPESLFMYLLSISRTNVEYMILMWRDGLLKGQQARSCFVNLFQALSLNAKLVLPMHFTVFWSQVTGIYMPESNDQQDVLIFTKEVPILLKDCSALLLQFLYALPFNIDKAYFLTITQALLNLNFIQALMMVSYHMPLDQRQSFKSRILLKEDNHRHPAMFSTFFDYIVFMMNCITPNSLLNNNPHLKGNTEHLTEKKMLDMIVKLCLPFMRMASMLFYMLYEEPLPDYPNVNPQNCPLEEFANLARFLTLNPQDSLEVEEISPDESFFRPYLNWFLNDPSLLIQRWYEEYENSLNFDSLSIAMIIGENMMFVAKPRLLNLPRIYEQLFMFYHKRRCSNCEKVSKDPSICLVCGMMVCIRDNCCRVGKVLEGVRHSKSCGAGTAIYLAVNSSLIYVVRGQKACIWGSVYLDEFGEEDRDLKRGKPLFLSIERYRLLEQQWLSHIFPNINKKWVPHKDLV